MTEFRKISDNNSSDAAIVLRGLGTQGIPHPDFTAFLVGQKMEVHFVDRNGDVLLRESQAIETYCREIRENIAELIHFGKRVHLVGISFGGFLSLELARDVRTSVASVVAIAPLLDPYTVISNFSKSSESSDFAYASLANGLILPILRQNIDAVKEWKPENIVPPSIVIMGERDEYEKTANLNRVSGIHVAKHILPGIRHEETTGHPKTRELIGEFYVRVL